MAMRLAFLAAAILVAACSGAVPSASVAPSVAPTDTPTEAVDQAPPPIDDQMVQQACQFGAVVFDVGPIKLCQNAIGLAIARLGIVHWPVTSISFRLDLCPPGAPCAAPSMQDGWVIFTFTTGLPVMVHVGPVVPGVGVDGPLIAGPVQEVPEWLAAEVKSAGQNGP